MRVVRSTTMHVCALCISLFAVTELSAADSDQTVCAKLGDNDGMSYVIPNGSTNGSLYIKHLHLGQQDLPWRENGWLYFVVSENDDQLETVEHFRVITMDSANGQGSNVSVGLDRNVVDSQCYDGISKWWLGYSAEFHRSTSVDFYDMRRHPENKYIDNNLNRWHFNWLHVLDGKKNCDHTAGHVPAIQEENTGNNVAPALKNLQPSEAVAAAAIAKVPVPANVSAMSMVLVHRKQDGASCLGIPLGSKSMPEQSRINRLRFGKVGQRFLGPGTVINWVE